ncbi:ParB N-terminal domain-containing protein [Mycolicibacterium sp.]|uniref:ParB N-terminal domain-containing protein n=1 Tax=Mycolicibacterium sp. TaxID=2320850 RepID=UPI0037CC4B65
MTTPDNPPAKTVADLGEAVRLPTSSVKLAGDNPRKIPQRAIEVVAASLQRFGWQQPLVVDRDHVIIAGHTRLQAAQYLGLKEVPAIIATNLTDEEVRAYRIADNRTHDFTTWDYPELVVQLDSLADEFGDVLALQDWQAIVSDFTNIEDSAVDVPDDIKPHFDPNGGFQVLVVFKSEEAAVAVEQQIMDMPGVIDVRHKR